MKTALGKGRHIPERSCVACGQKLPKQELTRIVRTAEGTATVDRSGNMAGRGAYLCRSSVCWQRGLQKGGLERSLKLTLSSHDRARLLAYSQEAGAGPFTEG